MTPELKELYHYTMAQKDKEIAELKAKITALEKELQRERGGEKLRVDQIVMNPACPTITV